MLWKIGHRGACGHAPENTLLSMRKALEFGVDGFEFDIQMSKDGEPVVIHDNTLDRTTNGSGNVCDYTLKELQELDAGLGEKIPSLRNVFDMVDRRCRLFIELKAEDSALPVVEIIENYVRHHGWNYEQIFVSAFDHFQIDEVRQKNSQIRTCALLVGIPLSLAAIAQEAGAWAINPCLEHMNRALVDDAHKRNLKVFTWTCKTLQSIARAKAFGVDGIISDYPDLIPVA